MWDLDYKENWAPKNWCFWTVVLEKTLESPLDYKEIQPVHPKGDQSCVFIGRTDVEAETPILWQPDAKSWLIWKDPDAGKDWGQEEKGTTEDAIWMASLTQWTRVWVNSGSWWWTGRPGVLQFMGSQRVGHDWATELNWTELKHLDCFHFGAIVNSAANICVHISVWVPVFTSLRHITRSGITESFYAFDSVFNYVNYTILFPTVAALFYIHTSSVQEFWFLYILSETLLSKFFLFVLFYFGFDNSHCCGFGLHFPSV